VCNTGGSQCGRIDMLRTSNCKHVPSELRCGEGVFIGVSQFEKGVSGYMVRFWMSYWPTQ